MYTLIFDWLFHSYIHTLCMCIYAYVYSSYLPAAIYIFIILAYGCPVSLSPFPLNLLIPLCLLLLTESLPCLAFGDPLTLMRTAYMSHACGSSP